MEYRHSRSPKIVSFTLIKGVEMYPFTIDVLFLMNIVAVLWYNVYVLLMWHVYMITVKTNIGF